MDTKKINRVCASANYGLDLAECTTLLSQVDHTLSTGKWGKSNVILTAVMLNTWLSMFDDYPLIQRFVLSTLKRRGLIETISMCSDTADVLIADADGIQTDLPKTAFFQLFESLDLDDALQLLRFPKRFTLPGNGKCEQVAYAKFAEINHNCIKTFRKNSDNGYLMALLRHYCSVILKDFDKYLEEAEPEFSNGSVLSDWRDLRHNSIEAKCRGLAEFQPYLESPLYMISSHKKIKLSEQYLSFKGTFSYSGAPNVYKRYYNQRTDFKEGYVIAVEAVPKTYAKARIIAPEHPYAAWNMQRVRKAMERCLAESEYGCLAPIRDADINRLLCREASITHEYACVDMSSASDTISYWLASNILPPNVVKEIDRFRPPYVAIPDEAGVRKNTLLGTYLTSGSPACFITETIIILSAYLAGRDIAKVAYPDDELLMPLVFGDDGLCDVRTLSTMYDVFSKMGMIVNGDKTYYGYFRENCGVEYLNGLPTKSKYWPRKALSLVGRDASLTVKSLSDLQHRLFWRFPRATAVLEDFVVAIEPRMTFSRPGSVNDDLWSLVETVNDPASGPNPRGAEGQYHLTLLPRYTEYRVARAVYKSSWLANTDMFAYYKFLKDGPSFDDPLMELLGVSSRPRYELPSHYDWVRVLQPDD